MLLSCRSLDLAMAAYMHLLLQQLLQQPMQVVRSPADAAGSAMACLDLVSVK